MDKAARDTLDALRNFTRRTVKTANLDELADRLAEESERGVVVVFGSATEDLLEERILQNFVELDRERLKGMKRFGVLNNWASKASLAVALGIIDEDDAEVVEILKTMRNACAHSRLHIDFETPELRNALRLLLREELSPILDELHNKYGVRALFVQSCSTIWSRIRGATPLPYHEQLKVGIAEMLRRAKEQS
jgi:hypothetical protein